jgi:hypothetical protein
MNKIGVFQLPGGHLFFTEFPELFNPLVIDFVRSNPSDEGRS